MFDLCLKGKNKMEKLQQFEDIHTEYKKSQNSIPRAMWETVSSFANTDGGNIFLGVDEIKNGNSSYFKPCGVNSVNKLITDLLNTVKDKSKISTQAFKEDNIETLSYDNKKIIKISIPKAEYKNRPVYLNGDPKKTYIREGERDSKANEDDLKSILIDSKGTDNYDLLNGFDIDDLKIATIQNYRGILFDQTSDKNILNMSVPDFLKSIGLMRKDRKTNEFKLTKAALLLFGKFNSITDIYKSFMLDFIVKNTPLDVDYIDRVYTSNSIENPDNIFEFYIQVSEKMKSLVDNKFKLRDLIRKDDGEKLITVLREGLVNSLVHADYRSGLPTKISFFKDKIEFENAGQMRVSTENFFIRTDSKTRNDLIFQAFIQARLGEHTGSGGYRILSNTQQMKLKTPEITTDVKKTKLVIWKITEKDIIDSLPVKWQEPYKIISEKLVVSYSDLSYLFKTKYEGMKILKEMINAGLIIRSGKNKGTRYLISSDSPTIKRRTSEYIKLMQKGTF